MKIPAGEQVRTTIRPTDYGQGNASVDQKQADHILGETPRSKVETLKLKLDGVTEKLLSLKPLSSEDKVLLETEQRDLAEKLVDARQQAKLKIN